MLKAVIPRRAGLRRFHPSLTVALGRNDRNGKQPPLSMQPSYLSRPQSSLCLTDQSSPHSLVEPTQPTTTSSSAVWPDSDIKNTMDRASKIYMAQQILNYKFQNENLLWEALQAPGSNIAELDGRKLTQGNKSLASIGDAIITLVIRCDCHRMDRNIGETSESLQRLVNNYQLAFKCDETGLKACINNNQCQRGVVSPRTLADTLEAVIGAIYLDSDIDNAKLAIQSLQIFKNIKFDGFR
ncbi:ribonuclease III domain-containing protein [Xylaria castorea]|nr:ribonuclease III domain-containing protein [Xylaria castorea]